MNIRMFSFRGRHIGLEIIFTIKSFQILSIALIYTLQGLPSQSVASILLILAPLNAI